MNDKPKLIERGVSVDLLHRLLRLEAETGRLWWRERPVEMFSGSDKQHADAYARTWNTRYAGAEALFCVRSNGYRIGKILGKLFLAHRVVFALHHGRWPADQIDHKDGDRLNNRPDNLRAATSAENNRNKGALPGASSEFCGVSWCKQQQQWRAACRDSDGKYRHIGRFADEIEAARAYDAAAKEYHGEFAWLNFEDTQGGLQ